MVYLTKEHKRLFQLFYDYPEGFLVQYVNNDGVHHWFFVQYPKSPTSSHIMGHLCDDFKKASIIIPKIPDKEFQIQQAVGVAAQNRRVYKFNKKISKSRNRRFIDYLDKAAIVWL